MLFGPIPVPVDAKCAEREWTIEGRVEDIAGTSVPGALATLRLIYRGGPKLEEPRSVVVETDESGVFRAVFWQHTYSRALPFLGDRCRRKPPRLEVAAGAAGFESATRRVPRRELLAVVKRGQSEVTLSEPLVLGNAASKQKRRERLERLDLDRESRHVQPSEE